GSQGWTWLPADPGMSWQSAGGNPGGYMRFDNNVPYGAGATAAIYAPPTYLGNWSALGVTDVSYEANIFTTGSVARIDDHTVIIAGPGGTYRWLGPYPDPAISWRPLEAALVESDWAMMSGNWDSLLEDVSELRIEMAYYSNWGPFEITGIDNVQLNASVPEPATLGLLAIGFAVLGVVAIFRRQ
ncbi:MAG TPA: PEP-CTERM sorting domain-containing protein, partial [Thermoguttaceae bacterium]|nr:PEP-CTERM sorting domain-containing protein [Thermoguttaceae bacterium]